MTKHNGSVTVLDEVEGWSTADGRLTWIEPGTYRVTARKRYESGGAAIEFMTERGEYAISVAEGTEHAEVLRASDVRGMRA